MRISDWSSDVCSSDLQLQTPPDPNQERVIEHQSQPPQRRAHCRLGQSDLFTGAAHAAFAQQCLKDDKQVRSEEHTSELQSLMRISYAVFCLKKTKTTPINPDQ